MKMATEGGGSEGIEEYFIYILMIWRSNRRSKILLFFFLENLSNNVSQLDSDVEDEPR